MDLNEIDSNKWSKLAVHLSSPKTTAREPHSGPQGPRPGSKQRQRRFSTTEERQVVADYLAGGTVYSLADAYGCHRNTISRILKSHGVELANRPTDSRIVDEIVRLYRSGLSMEATASRTGVSAKTVLNHLRRRRVGTRAPTGVLKSHGAGLLPQAEPRCDHGEIVWDNDPQPQPREESNQ